MANYLTGNAPRYSMNWCGTRVICLLGMALILALVASWIDGFASLRVSEGLLTDTRYTLVSQSIAYCFATISITTMSLLLIEIAFRKEINYFQYSLIDLALILFYLLLLAMSEKLLFGASYLIVSIMTIGLISLFIKGITQNIKAVGMTAVILSVEYALIFVLISIGSMALLVGSLSLFILLALAMYLTLKLKIEDNELVIK